MLQTFLKSFNEYRKKKLFASPLYGAQKKYAFIGVGMHSLANFYPLLRHFNIQLKYICTRQSDYSSQLSPLFPGCIFTHDLQIILNDPAIAGVFVCTTPSAHYDLVRQLFAAGKHVFVEKPPCTTTTELNQLIDNNDGLVCKIGLQRRHWPANRYILNKCSDASSYIYRFETGPYIQGDIYTELFIHPLDYMTQLFGECTPASIHRHGQDSAFTLQMHVKHAKGASGLIQLSTQHSWNPPLEQLTVTTSKEELEISYPTRITGKKRPARLLGLPAERLLQQPAIIKEYFNAQPSMIPAADQNTLVIQGFMQEIETFIALVENTGRASGSENPRSDLNSLLPVYRLIDQCRSPHPTTSL